MEIGRLVARVEEVLAGVPGLDFASRCVYVDAARCLLRGIAGESEIVDFDYSVRPGEGAGVAEMTVIYPGGDRHVWTNSLIPVKVMPAGVQDTEG